jgi:hypothetical protein
VAILVNIPAIDGLGRWANFIFVAAVSVLLFASSFFSSSIARAALRKKCKIT